MFVCLFPVSIFLHFRKNVALQSRGGRHRVAYGRGWLGGDGACSWPDEGTGQLSDLAGRRRVRARRSGVAPLGAPRGGLREISAWRGVSVSLFFQPSKHVRAILRGGRDRSRRFAAVGDFSRISRSSTEGVTDPGAAGGRAWTGVGCCRPG